MTERAPQIVVDHDNLLTHGFAEHPLYKIEYYWNFSEVFHVPLQEIYSLVKDVESEIDANPDEVVLRVDGRIIGPTTIDHIWLTYSAAVRVLDRWRVHKKQAIEDVSGVEDARRFQYIFKTSYRKSGIIYRHDAREFIEDLHKTDRLSIVTGSDTDVVRMKLSELLRNTNVDPYALDIRGNAMKSLVDLSRDTDMPEKYLPAEYFPYPVYVRKPIYTSILRSFKQGIGVVISDSYYYDLAPAEQMKIYTILLLNEFTFGCEARYYKTHDNGALVRTLTEAREAIDHLI